MLTTKATTYSWRHLAHRIGILNAEVDETGFEQLGVSVHYGLPGIVQLQEATIIVIPCRDETWKGLLTRRDNTLSCTAVNQLVPEGVQLPFSDPIPVLFWGAGYEDGSTPFVDRLEDGTVVFYADILAATFFMLSRWEESVSPVRDQHGRFPATASVAYKQGFLDRPLVDEYALILQTWLQVLLPGWKPQPPSFSVQLSHDIDEVLRFSSWKQIGVALAIDILKRRSVRETWRTLNNLVHSRDPYFQGIYTLAELSEKSGLNSAFYFMAAMPDRYEQGYDPASPLVRRCIDELRSRGHEIGFHPGYHAVDDPKRFAWEKSRMDQILGTSRYGGRQHYLRFHTPDTWLQWEQLGLKYDSTLGYPDYEGFRCGTCHPFHPFHIELDHQLDLLEIPLIVMDGTLHQYRGLTPEQGEERILALAQRCQQVNGTFTLLWHNTSLDGAWRPWAGMYRSVLPQLARMMHNESATIDSI